MKMRYYIDLMVHLYNQFGILNIDYNDLNFEDMFQYMVEIHNL
jgi:hypothetical protein